MRIILLSKNIKVGLAATTAALGLFAFGAHYANASTNVTVKSGDTVSKIAQEYHATTNGIKKANNLKNVNRIFVGQRLVIPTSVSTEVAAPVAQPVQPAAKPVVKTAPVKAVKPVAKKAVVTPAPAKPAVQPVQKAAASKPAAQPVQPVAQPVQKPAAKPVVKTYVQPSQPAQPAPVKSTANTASYNGSTNDMSSIAMKESTNNYNARNGRYIGKYQLDSSYLHGDYSPANQEKVAHQYAISRYGSIANAVAFRNSHNYW